MSVQRKKSPMPIDGRQDERGNPASHRGGWYVIRGIPVATIIALFVAIVPQAVIFTVYLGRIAFVQEIHGQKIEFIEKKVDDVSTILAGTQVPSAINGRRLDELERQLAQIASGMVQLQSKMLDQERALATEAMRGRAARERP